MKITEEDLFGVRLCDIKNEIQIALIECSKRGLMQCTKWLAELKSGLDPQKLSAEIATVGRSSRNSNSNSGIQQIQEAFVTGIAENERDNYELAKCYFDLREFDRAAYFVRNAESAVPKFLHYYATYMAKEKRRLENTTDSSNFAEFGQARDQSDLMISLRSLYSQRKLDGYCLYLYGVVLKKLDLKDIAINVLVEAINAVPMLWSAYLELTTLLASREQLLTLKLPNHWLKVIFFAHAHIELYLNDEGLKMFEDLQASGFKNSNYITAQIALVYHNKRNVEKAIQIFQHLHEADPYRLDNLDIYSNLLFVKEMKKEMASLAHKAVEINKYRPETCCVIGNYYSIRADHTKAIVYFQRALKLDPQYLSAWTLMGHEFMEIKNINAAIQSYRKAVEVNRRDYRAWYGLGQSYEILKMPSYSLYYYKIAQELRPYDSRMLVALGETYEKLDRFTNAIKCYQKACNVGDIEGITLLRMGNLYEKLGNVEAAVPAYIEFCKDERAIADKSSLCRAYITLGNYYESIGKYDDASHFAHKCLNFEDVKTEAQALLNTIKNKRSSNPTAASTGPIVSSLIVKPSEPETVNVVDMEMSLEITTEEREFLASSTDMANATTEDDVISATDSE